MNNIIIEATKIEKSYKITKNNYLKVLKGVDISVREGEIVAIIGKSGAGKSTLLHILGALDKPDSGKIYIDGIDIANLNDKKLAEFRANDIGFIFQFHHLLPEFTALENVMIPTMIANSKMKNNPEKILNEVGLGDRLNHKPSELSGGEAQRVAIARALVNSPKIVLADEPTGNLDTENENAVIDLIFSLRNKYNYTFIIVTHNNDFSNKCDRIIKISDGLII